MKTRYLTKQRTSDNWYFRFELPKDVRGRLPHPNTIKRTTKTSDLKKAQRLADRWASELHEEIEKARGTDWKYWTMKASVDGYKQQGMSEDQIYDIGNQVLETDEEFESLDKIMGKIVVLRDHVDGYRAYISGHNAPSSVASKMTRLQGLVDRFETLDDITIPEVMQWSAEVGGSKSTQVAKRSCYMDFLKYLSTEVLFKPLDTSPFNYVVTSRSRQKHKDEWTNEEFHQLLAEATPPTRQALMMAAYTGRRAIAIANLKVCDVDLTNKTFTFRIDKGLTEQDKPHVVPIHSKLIPLVEELCVSDNNGGYLLSGSGSEAYKRGAVLSTRVGKLTRRLGYADKGKSLHSFRTTVINKLANAGHDGLRGRSLVGHSLGKGVDAKSYLKPLKPESLIEAVEAIEW